MGLFGTFRGEFTEISKFLSLTGEVLVCKALLIDSCVVLAVVVAPWWDQVINCNSEIAILFILLSYFHLKPFFQVFKIKSDAKSCD